MVTFWFAVNNVTSQCELADISQGLAFRSVQDIGLQCDSPREESLISGLDAEIRRRIYWGCYTADGYVPLKRARSVPRTEHNSIIALLLGRPVFFKDCDAAVSPSEPLPLVLRHLPICLVH